MRAIAGLAFFVVMSSWGQEYKPYPLAKISRQEWQTYFDEVRAKQMVTERRFPDENLVTYYSVATGMNWAFTTPGHLAHPAWIARHVVVRDGQTLVDQIGYFAGDEAPFSALFQSYQKLTDRTTAKLPNSGAK
jgi:hypothetical protein